MKSSRRFAEKIYDTLFGNIQYPQLELSKVKDQFIDYETDEITILYGKTAYRLKVERLKGRHEDLTTV